MTNHQQQPGDVPTSIYPIKSLNPYQNRWTIKARVTSKSDLRSWNNQKGSGKLFHVDLLDAQGGEIRATMFNDAAETFFATFEVGKVYFISKGTLKIANKKFTSISNEYELSLDRNSQITLCNDAGDIPSMHYNFVPIQSINDYQKDEIVDVLGVAVAVGECDTIMTKQSKELKKRNITLIDRTGYSIDFTLWGEKAENPGQLTDHSILAIKGAKVSTFNNKTLTSVNSTHIEVDPVDIREAVALRSWFDTEGVTLQYNPLTRGRESGQFGDSASHGPAEVKTFEEVKAATTGVRDKPVYFDVKGTITIIRQEGSPWYYSCHECNRKVVNVTDGWKCDVCNKTFDRPKPRYILSFCAADHTGSQWLSCFNDVAEAILGPNAEQMEQWRDMKDPSFEQTFQKAVHKQYKFRLRGKEEIYQDKWKLKCTVISATGVDLVNDSAILLNKIAMLQR